MTYEEVKNGLENLLCESGKAPRGYIEHIVMAIPAVKKQIPKKPIKNNRAFFCPVCEKNVGLTLEYNGTKISHFEHYCEKCGQAIDWSEEE